MAVGTEGERPRLQGFASTVLESARLRFRDERQQWMIVAAAGITFGVSVLVLSFSAAKWLPYSFMALLFLCAAMITGAPRKLLLAAALIDIPLQLDTHLAYRPELGRLGGLMGFSLSVTTVAVVALYVLWWSRRMAGLEAGSVVPFRTWAPAGLYVFFTGLSLLAASDVMAGLYEVVLLAQTLLLYVYVCSNIRTSADVRFVVSMLLLGLILESLIMISLNAGALNLQIPGIATRVDIETRGGPEMRVGGTIGSPNTGASYLSLLLAPALSLLFARWGRRYDWLSIGAFGLGAIALVLPFSRGAWLAAGSSCVVLGILVWHRGWMPLKVPATAILLVALLALLFYQPIVDRLLGGDHGSALSRIYLGRIALGMIADKPLLGVGANNYAVVLNEYVPGDLWGRFVYVVHNKYLLTWAETGVGGFISFIVFLLVTLRRGWRAWRRKDPMLSPVALALALAVAGQMIHMMVDIFHARSQVQLLWVVAGLIVALDSMTERRAECHATPR